MPTVISWQLPTASWAEASKGQVNAKLEAKGVVRGVRGKGGEEGGEEQAKKKARGSVER